MTSSTMRLMIATAALAVAAGSASAQSYKADIPVAFRAADKVMSPGSYDIRVSRGTASEFVIVRELATNKSVMLVAYTRSDAPRQWRDAGDPKLALECAGGACSLRKMWNGLDSYMYSFTGPKAPAGENVAHRIDVVTLTMIKSH